MIRKHVLVMASDFNDPGIMATDFGKILRCQIPLQSVQFEPSCSMSTDRRTQTDRHSENDIGFSQYFEPTYRGADKSLARPTSRCILFDDENISFDASLVIYTYIYIYIYIYIVLILLQL